MIKIICIITAIFKELNIKLVILIDNSQIPDWRNYQNFSEFKNNANEPDIEV